MGVTLLFAGQEANRKADEFSDRGITTDAVVLRIEKNGPHHHRKTKGRAGSLGTTFRPIVRYTDAEGVTREGFSLETKAEYEKLPIGSTVTITYLPEAPEEVLLNEDTLYTSPFIWIPIGGAIILFGCWNVYRAFPGKKKN